jgi:hypothetical protein
MLVVMANQGHKAIKERVERVERKHLSALAKQSVNPLEIGSKPSLQHVVISI